MLFRMLDSVFARIVQPLGSCNYGVAVGPAALSNRRIYFGPSDQSRIPENQTTSGCRQAVVRAGTALSVSGPALRRKCQKREPLEHVVQVVFSARVAAGGQVAVADLGHPAGTRQMVFDRLAGSLGFAVGVDAENEPGHLVLAQALVIGVEKANVGFDMPVVVFGDAVRPGDLGPSA